MWNIDMLWLCYVYLIFIYVCYVVVAVGCICWCYVCPINLFSIWKVWASAVAQGQLSNVVEATLTFFTVLHRFVTGVKKGLLLAPPPPYCACFIHRCPSHIHTSTGLGQSMSASGVKSPPQRLESQATLKLKERNLQAVQFLDRTPQHNATATLLQYYIYNTATCHMLTLTCSTSWYILVVHRSTSSWQNTLYAQKEKIETGLQEDSLMAMSSVHSTEKCSRVQKPQPDLSVWAIDAKSWLKFIHRFTSLHSTFRSWCTAVLSGTICLVHYLRLEGTATLATEPLQKLLVMTLVPGGPILITLRCIKMKRDEDAEVTEWGHEKLNMTRSMRGLA